MSRVEVISRLICEVSVAVRGMRDGGSSVVCWACMRGSDHGWTISELARRTRYDRALVRRHLADFSARGWVHVGADGRYRMTTEGSVGDAAAIAEFYAGASPWLRALIDAAAD